MRVYIRIAMIKGLEKCTSKRQKIKWIRVPCSYTETFISTFGALLVGRRQSSILQVRSFRVAGCDTDHYLVVANGRERLAVSKQAAQKLDGKYLI
jgi:hypothetical protein